MQSCPLAVEDGLCPPAHTAQQAEDPHAEEVMRTYKIQLCPKRFPHDWMACKHAHPREKAKRRDPAVHSYAAIACPSMRQGTPCALGEACPFAHNVFEYWLHPSRYRTQLCNDGASCKRKLCFFAHSLGELRVPTCQPFVARGALAEAAPVQAPLQLCPAEGQRHALVIQQVAAMLERGELSPASSAEVLRTVLPPAVLGELEAQLSGGATSAACLPAPRLPALHQPPAACLPDWACLAPPPATALAAAPAASLLAHAAALPSAHALWAFPGWQPPATAAAPPLLARQSWPPADACVSTRSSFDSDCSSTGRHTWGSGSCASLACASRCSA